MAEAAQSLVEMSTTSTTKLPGRGARITIPPSAVAMPTNSTASRLRSQLGLAASSPVNQNGSFEFDRVIKAGIVQKRTQKTKTWKSVYLVLRPSTLYIYKSEKESKLRHKIYTPELSAVTLLKDSKQKRHNLFGLFSPAKNFHFEAPSAKDAQEWIELIRQDARIEEEEEEMFLSSPGARRQSYAAVGILGNTSGVLKKTSLDNERLGSSSPEPHERPTSIAKYSPPRRPSHNLDYSGLSGNELASHSDFSDNEMLRRGVSIENLAVRSLSASMTQLATDPKGRPTLGDRNISQLSCFNTEQDPDRVVWQGRLLFLKSKRGGVRQWKDCWAVLRPRNLILYKDESEYMATFIVALSAIVNVVDIDPISRTKRNCMQIITDEKSYRFCAFDEESLVQCLGAFKSLLSKRRDLEARQGAVPAANATPR